MSMMDRMRRKLLTAKLGSKRGSALAKHLPVKRSEVYPRAGSLGRSRGRSIPVGKSEVDPEEGSGSEFNPDGSEVNPSMFPLPSHLIPGIAVTPKNLTVSEYEEADLGRTIRLPSKPRINSPHR